MNIRILQKKYLFLFLLFIGALGIGLLPSKDPLERIKKQAMEYAIQDTTGNPIVSKDYVEEYVLLRSSRFDISYQKGFDLFLISINSSPFEEARAEAEQTFLSLLDIDEATACKLSVHVVTPFFANPEFSGILFPLQFCDQ